MDPQEIRLFEQIIERLKLVPESHVADFGCGSGGALPTLFQAVPLGKVDALDLRPQALKNVQSRYSSDRLQLIQHDLLKPLPYQEDTLDCILMSKVIEPFTKPESFLPEAYRVLKPGGLFLVTHWDFDGMLFTHPDRELTRQMIHLYADHPPWLRHPAQAPPEQVETHPSSAFDIPPQQTPCAIPARDLPGILRSSPFNRAGRITTQVVALSSFSYQPGLIGHRYARYLAAYAARHRDIGPQASYVWLQRFEELEAERQFFFTVPVIVILAKKSL